MNISQLKVKVTASITVNSLYEWNKFNLAVVNEIIFQLQNSSHADT